MYRNPVNLNWGLFPPKAIHLCLSWKPGSQVSKLNSGVSIQLTLFTASPKNQIPVLVLAVTFRSILFLYLLSAPIFQLRLWFVSSLNLQGGVKMRSLEISFIFCKVSNKSRTTHYLESVLQQEGPISGNLPAIYLNWKSAMTTLGLMLCSLDFRVILPVNTHIHRTLLQYLFGFH